MNVCDKILKTKEKLIKLQGEKNTYTKILKRANTNLAQLEEQRDRFSKCIVVCQYVIESRQKSVVTVFEETVSSALKEVFNERYEFKLEFGKRNNVTTVEFMVHTGEYDGFLPIKMCQGNSVSQTIGTILRLMFVSILDGRNVVVLDESLGGLELEKESKVGEFLRTICKKLNIQVVMVTHKVTLAEQADKKIMVK